MKTTIGQALGRSPRKRIVTAFVAGGIVALDMALVGCNVRVEFRLAVALAALVVYGLLAGWDRDSLGWKLRPLQGWLYWGVAALVMGGIILVAALAAGGIYLLVAGTDRPAHLLFREPSEFWPWALHACLLFPVLEELIYRFVLCTSTAAVTKPWVAIVLSGCIFAALHVVYGNPGVDNFLAGFLLGWAYLKSGSLIVPLSLHALGNLSVGLLHVAACYCFS